MAEEKKAEKLLKADFLRSEGRYDEAMRLANEHLNESFDDPQALFLIGNILIETGKFGLAHTLYKQFLGLKPNVPHGWNNLGRCYHDNHAIEEAERCFRRAFKMDPNDAITCCNIGLVNLYKGDLDKAIEFSEKAIALNPDYRNAKHNLGLAYLSKHEWVKGWTAYEASVGSSADRRERVYGDEQRWDGTPGKCVIAYGEQGLGDEISFASIIPDLAKDCKETVIECDKRLEGLFKRSFPQVKAVYGTRYKDMIEWADKHKIEARVSFGSLGKFYRKSTSDFDGKPYLVADPERRLQWRALLDSIDDKPKIGIAWQGGINRTGKARRSVTLEALEPVLRQNATFISLQYKNAQDEVDQMYEKHGIKVWHWPRAVEAPDYDETAALVAELDGVVSVTTAGIHLAGGLGIPCLCLTPLNPMWRYGHEGDTMPWYNSVRLIRQKKPGQWYDPIAEAAYQLRDLLRVKHGHGLCQPEISNRLVA